jgi:hypothetical protein
LVNDQERLYFGRGDSSDQIVIIDNMRAVFGRSYADESGKLIEQLKADEAIAEADTLLLTVPNQLGVDYNAHVLEAVLTHVAPSWGGGEGSGPGWRRAHRQLVTPSETLHSVIPPS